MLVGATVGNGVVGAVVVGVLVTALCVGALVVVGLGDIVGVLVNVGTAVGLFEFTFSSCKLRLCFAFNNSKSIISSDRKASLR